MCHNLGEMPKDLPSTSVKHASRRKLVMVWSALLAVAVGLAVSAGMYEMFPGDQPASSWVQSIDGPAFGDGMEVVSELGDWTWAMIVTASTVVLLALFRRWAEAGYVAVITIASTFINDLIKVLVDRPRPTSDLVEVMEELGSKGFPSGHVVYATTFYGLLLAFSLFMDVKPRWTLRIVQLFFTAMILAMGLSRIYLGVHWLSDVLGAYVVGGLYVVGGVLWRDSRYSLERLAPRAAQFRQRLSLKNQAERKSD